jgi:DNA-binding response OmpR family regulator
MQPPIVLCLDDDESLLLLLEMALELNGYVPMSATSGCEALRLALTHPIDAAILDYELPDICGAEVARELKQIRPDIPILMFSGTGDIPPSDVVHADAIVSKNAGLSALLAVLQRLRRRREMRQPTLRRFRRYQVQSPFEITAERSGQPLIYRGYSTVIGEGGIGAKLDGDLTPSEFVLLRLFDSRLRAPLERRAQVRYRNNKAYGFEFVDMTPEQRDEVRKFCELLAAA